MSYELYMSRQTMYDKCLESYKSSYNLEINIVHESH